MKPEEYIRNEVESRGMKMKFLSDKANVPYLATPNGKR